MRKGDKKMKKQNEEIVEATQQELEEFAKQNSKREFKSFVWGITISALVALTVGVVVLSVKNSDLEFELVKVKKELFEIKERTKEKDKNALPRLFIPPVKIQ